MLETAVTVEDYAEAKKTLEVLGNYKDCSEKIKEADYRCVELTFSEAIGVDDIDRAQAVFESLGDYLDCANYVAKCKIQRELYRFNNVDNEAEAYHNLLKLSAEGVPGASEAADRCEAEIFNTAREYYSDGDFKPAYALLLEINNTDKYEDYDLYRIISMINTLLDNRLVLEDWEYEILFAHLDQPEAREAVMRRTDIAQEYLLGNWKSEDGKKYMYMTESGSTNNNMPFTAIYDVYWSICDGDYIRTKWNDPSVFAVEFHISIIDYNSIQLDSYHDDSSFVLYRK